MTAHLTEEEQIESLKRWWAENGKSTIVGVALAVAGYLGWGAWQDKQQADAEAASAIFQELQQATTVTPGENLSEEQTATAKHLADQLIGSYSSSLYASQASLMKAKLAVNIGDLDTAADALQWVVEQDVEPALTLLARSRLARVQLDQGQLDAALETVSDQGSGSFKALFAEIRGDVLLVKGDKAKAREAYQMALGALLADQAARRPLLEMKISDLQAPAPAEDKAVEAGQEGEA